MRAKADVGAGGRQGPELCTERRGPWSWIRRTLSVDRKRWQLTAADYHRFDIGLKFLRELSMMGVIKERTRRPRTMAEQLQRLSGSRSHCTFNG